MRSLRQLFEALKIAFDSLRANKARGVLTTLGIIIGIVAVITTMTAANGLSNNFRESVSALGSDVLYVSRMPWIITGNFFEFRNRPNLTLDEAELLARRMDSALAVNPTVDTSKSIKYRRPRGFFCAIGRCSACMMEVDGVPNARTCVVMCKEGMQIKRQK